MNEFVTSGGLVETPGVPEVRDVVTARFDAAAPTARQMVCAAAVIGSIADPELLRIACGRDEGESVDAIEEAISRGLLVERADRPGYDVPHDLLRTIALERLSLARARLLHGRVADVLARRHAVDPLKTPAGAVARHLAAAGRDEEATGWHLTAAEEASRLYAHAEALEQLDAARSLGHRPIDVNHATGMTLVRLGRYADALESLDRAAALAEDLPERQSQIEHAIGRVYDRLGEHDLALAHLEAARDLLPEPAPARARILSDLALTQRRRDRRDEARASAEEALVLSSGDPASTAQAANVLGLLDADAGVTEAAERHLVAAVDNARAAKDLDLLIAALNNLAHARRRRDDPEAALDAAREALALAERQGDRHRLAVLHSHVADLLHAAGRQEEAEAQMRSSAAAFADVQEARERPELWTLSDW